MLTMGHQVAMPEMPVMGVTNAENYTFGHVQQHSIIKRKCYVQDYTEHVLNEQVAQHIAAFPQLTHMAP